MNVLLTTLNAKFIHKNLALRYLYQTAPKDINVSIKEYTIKDDINNIITNILSYSPDVVGFSTYIWNVDYIKDICKNIKEINPSVKIVLGGPEVSFEPEFFLDNFAIDAVSCGEGEFTIWEYVQNCNKINIDIPGIFTRASKPTIGYSIVDLNELEKYDNPYFLDFDEKDMKNRYLYVETSRGCPYRCSYCLSSVLGKVRLFSTDYIKRVLDQIFESDAKQIKFLDRTFNVDKNRALELARYIDEHAREDQVFQFEIMAEHLSDELIEYLSNRKELPRFRFEIGIQTTNVNALKEISRYQNFDKLSEVIQKLRKNNNCEMHVDLIAGLPLEDLDSFKNSFDEVFHLHAHELQLGFLKLLRGTLMKKNSLDYGMTYDEHAPYEIFETKWMSKQDIHEIHTACYALDILYNKPRLRKTIDTIINVYSISPFELFYKLGQDLYLNKYNQIDLIFKSVLNTLDNAYKISNVVGMLNEEYYQLFKQKTKRIIDFKIDDEYRNSLLNRLFDSGIASKNDLINYGVFAEGDNCMLFVLYNKLQSYPKLYRIYEDKIEEI
ncbi:MAG: DUF4080 domain-containing protein [Erysipelotrichales bacterium]|nr:DUF4080 domain-containing protein [Erysipelotrichales bacterium]